MTGYVIVDATVEYHGKQDKSYIPFNKPQSALMYKKVDCIVYMIRKKEFHVYDGVETKGKCHFSFNFCETGTLRQCE